MTQDSLDPSLKERVNTFPKILTNSVLQLEKDKKKTTFYTDKK